MARLGLIFISAFITVQALAQDYGDSTITLTLTQRTAWWIARGMKDNFNPDNAEEYFTVRAALKKAVGSGNNPDSVFTATIKAVYIKNAMELLVSRQLTFSIDDYNSIMLNSPSIPGYTALQNQIVSKANGNSAQKQTAIWLRDWFIERKQNFAELYTEEKARIIKWAN